jgi:copper(I)-binding protein
MEIRLKSIKLIPTFVIALLMLNACSSSSGVLSVQDAWARPASAGENGAAYFVIENGTAADDILLSASSEIAAATEIHKSMMMDGGMMSMQQQKSVPVPAKGQVEFKTGGLHVMFVNLTRDLKVGDTITITLIFEKAGSMTIQAIVKEP